GRVWRMYHFIEGTRTFTSPRSSAQATAAARAFGEFQALLADLPSPPLHETIPHFHDTPRRFAALRTSIADDAHRRAANAADEIAFCLAREASAGLLTDLHRRGAIPQRIVHNDAKISNVLFDDAGREAICVVDLDTVMPGLSLYDFGDMVRSMACSAAEDERDLSRVEVSPERFAALAAGYLEATGNLLVPAEREHLVDAARIITLEQGVRFLTDYLDGDRYYQTKRLNHNLDRCRTQLKLVASIERQAATLRRAASA
ncbi:MAG: aminoglycoside phosphotransferase family protein, partial [Planctomycetota bacterium]